MLIHSNDVIYDLDIDIYIINNVEIFFRHKMNVL